MTTCARALANLIALTRAVPLLDLDGNPATDGHRRHAHSFLRLVAGRHHRQRLRGHAGRAPTSSRCRCSRPAAESWRRCASRRVIHPSSTMASRPRVSRPARSVYWEFVHAAQAVVESGDGCNYAANWITKPTLMQMIQGTPGVATKPTDRAVPNSSTLRLAESARRADDHGDADQPAPASTASRDSPKAVTARSHCPRAPRSGPETLAVVRRSAHEARFVPRTPAACRFGRQPGDTRAAVRLPAVRSQGAAFGPLFFSQGLVHSMAENPPAKQGFIARMRAKINRPGSWLSYDLAEPGARPQDRRRSPRRTRNPPADRRRRRRRHAAHPRRAAQESGAQGTRRRQRADRGADRCNHRHPAAVTETARAHTRSPSCCWWWA